MKLAHRAFRGAPQIGALSAFIALAVVSAAACTSAPAKREYPTLANETEPTLETVKVARSQRSNVLGEDLRKTVAGAVFYVKPFASLLLYNEERIGAQDVIASWASGEGLNVLPAATTEERITRGMAGLDGLTGKACGPKLQRSIAEDRWLITTAAQGSLKADVWCSERCTLQVEILLFGRGTEFFAAPYDVSQPWEQELPKRLRELRDNGGHNEHGHLNNPVSITGITRAAGRDIVADDAAAVASAIPDTVAAAVRTCNVTSQGMNVLLSIEGGKPRCQTIVHPKYIGDWDSEVEACVCAAAAPLATSVRATFRANGTSRVALGVKTKNGLTVSADAIGGSDLRERGVAWFIPGDEQHDVSRCFANRTVPAPSAEQRAAIYFNSQGIPEKFDWEQPATTLKPDELACVTKVLQTARAACPAKQPWVGEARVRFSVE